MSEFLTPERFDLTGEPCRVLRLPLPPAPTRQILNEVVVELQEHLEYLMLFRFEEALWPEIGSDHIRPIGAWLAEIALLMPRGETARVAEQVPSGAMDASSAPAEPAPSRGIGLGT